MGDGDQSANVPITEWPVVVNDLKLKPKKCHLGQSEDDANICSSEGRKRHREEEEGEDRQNERMCKYQKSQDVVTADVALAKWWRRHGRRLISPSVLPKSTNPNTILNYVQRTDIAKDFLKSELKKLTSMSLDAGQTFSKKESVQLHSALASYHEKLGHINIAKLEVNKALQYDPEAKEVLWLSEKLDRQLEIKSVQQKHLAVLQLHPDEIRCFPHYTKVARRSCKDLSFQEFFTKYCKTSTPVVITDYLPLMTDTPWTLDHIKQKAGKCNINLKKHVAESVEWARLETAKMWTVAEFIAGLSGDGEDSEKLYLFDWSLPLHCPELANEITIPRYFAGDFLQRTSPGSLYKDSWPSLFISPEGVTAELHVDAFGSNFWMALFEGRKRWVFFPAEDQPLLYPQYTCSMDPVFDVDLQKPDLTTHPLLSLTHPMECVLEPGDLLFVPAGCPHRVKNLEASLAISGNFVDLSNFESVKEELRISALVDPRADDLLKQFTSESFVSKMTSSMSDLPWEEYKQWPPDSLHDYDMSV